MKLILMVAIFSFLAGCDKSSETADGQRYQLHTTADGKAFRIDTQTGQISLVTDKGITALPDDRKVQLKIGEIYTLENGKSAIYEGSEKFKATPNVVDFHSLPK